jgi:hypothetical protein
MLDPNGNAENQYQEFLAVKVKDDLLNSVNISEELIIRLDSYPYIYQKTSCIDGSFKGSCSLYGFDIDTKLSYVQLSSLGSSGTGFSENLDDPIISNMVASKNVNGENIVVSLRVRAENAQAREKYVTFALITAAEEGEVEDILLEMNVLTEVESDLEYDYKAQANEAKIIIGNREFTFNFLDKSLKENI